MFATLMNNLPATITALGALVSAVASLYAAMKAAQTHTIVSGQNQGPQP